MFLAGCGLTTNPAKAAPEQWVEEPAVSAKAQELYSTADIESAYAAITDFALQRGYDPALMDPQQSNYTAVQLTAGLLGRVTPAFQELWVAKVDSALKGNADDQDGLRILQFYKWDQPTWKIPADGRHVLNQWVRNAEIGATQATADTPVRLKVTFVHQAGVRYLEDGVAFNLDVAKRVSYWLLPNPGGTPAWLIDEYEGEFAVGKDLPVLPDNQSTALPTPTASPFYTPAPTSVAIPNTGAAPA